MEMARGWPELGVVGTIYEDDAEEEDGTFTLSSSAATGASGLSPPPPPLRGSSLQKLADKWSQVNASKADVTVHVEDQRFHLHKDLLMMQSGYFKRELADRSDVAVALPAFLSAEAFTDAVASCYGAEVAIKPSTLVTLRAAAEWLELADADVRGMSALHGLMSQTEDYFFQEIATDAAHATAVLEACAGLLRVDGAIKTAAALFVRCVEVLSASSGSSDGRWLDIVAALPAEDFATVADAMRARFHHDHDLLYSVIDHYLQNHHGSKLSEEDKSRVCYSVDCTKLSPQHFMHLVQNPRLPLRFVVQAMLVEQLHSHHSILRTATATAGKAAAAGVPNSMTLGDILQRDAVLRQSAHIRASMQFTSRRIETLERELAGLRRRLRCSEEENAINAAAVVPGNARSASFRIFRRRGWGEDGGSAADAKSVNAKDGPWAGSKLVQGIKSLFRRPGPGGGGRDNVDSSKNAEDCDIVVDEKDSGDDDDGIGVKPPGHRRNSSLG